MSVVEKNNVYEGRVVDFTHEGHGVIKMERYPIFVPQVLVNEWVSFKIIKVKKNFAIGRLVEVKERSASRVEPPCQYFYKCGGCQLQHISYETQLDMKREQVINLFERKGKFSNIKIKDTVGMQNPWTYRNKSQIPVGIDKEGKVKMGFYRQRSHDIIDIDECLIQYDEQDAIMGFLKQTIQKYHIKPYQEEKHKGLLRHVVIRKGHFTNEVMVIFVLNGTKLPHQEALIQDLTTQFPHITSIKININTDKSNVIMGKTSHTLYGKEVIIDYLNDVTFEISDLSFYQINVTQTQKLYTIAKNYAQLTGEEIVLDTYCGIGTIGLMMAPYAKHVYGVEVVKEAIEDAKRNALNNQMANTTFEAGAAEDVMLRWKEEGIKPDVVTVDPPRKGCDETFIQTLLELEPERIVYISCNPSTQLRDVQLLSDKYVIKEITPVDMFPQTTHVETVALLTKK
ncbi:23S rRNA (uracil(1939)-C(5))-methyltransferase RlmD [Staphylococcus felis]|uniref:23S rRNA (uracil(1939)-C(5))-methyltransferase RlmD n=1 Tax=Staphylococcus felis TaxID=46127 RepID=UPI000E273D4C|nr:23S rRNA (uracil(1939)-C(5))-methyltransferase RlmD [Staphylococcus felis]REH85085.1 23S rRNA (uracil(1939)-C(5))-methyltransferase RlmD [Staphylococcus felis]REH88927.1 23S rRNA (uracil(1939)-C(5))-methyltransferase RlmD [Staphylococcus felis]